MDGMETEHIRRKNYIRGKDPFGVTISNIERLLNAGIKVTVRLNLDRNNIGSIYELADYLIERFAGNRRFNMYSKCLYDEVSKSAFDTSPEQLHFLLDKKEQLDNHLLARRIYDYEKLAPFGYRTYSCAADDPHKVVIAPNGNLCSCECVTPKTVFWGNVRQGITNINLYRDWHKNSLRQKCHGCVFLPICTPFEHCPTDFFFFDCKSRFSYTQKKYISETMRRWNSGELPIGSNEIIDYDF